MSGTLVIRADASPTVGTGHVMRCLALAEAWQVAGGRAVWIGHCPVESLRRRIRAAVPVFEPLERIHPHAGDLAATRTSLARVAKEIGSLEITWLALDGAHFDPAYQEAVRPSEGRMLVIDDQAQWPQYHADLLLNQNLDAEQLSYACDEHANFLLGPCYALLRPEFLSLKNLQRTTTDVGHGRPVRLLVTLGGADPENVTRTVVQALEKLDLPAWEARVIVGAANPHGKTLRPQVQLPAGKVQLFADVTNMPEQMAWADVALSAAGSTCWEMAFLGLPAVVIELADNQRAVAGPLAAAGTIVNLGAFDQITPERIAAALTELCRDASRRAAMSEAGRRLVDGRGAQRVVDVMSALDDPIPESRLQLRPPRAADMLSLWRLANDPTTRRFSLHPDPIPLDQHVAWFHDRLARPETAFWVFDFQGLILASIRYERTDAETAEVNLSVALTFRRRGLGSKLLLRTLRLVRERLGVRRLRAVVRRENVPSSRIFLKAGFRQVESTPIEGHACLVFERDT